MSYLLKSGFFKKYKYMEYKILGLITVQLAVVSYCIFCISYNT